MRNTMNQVNTNGTKDITQTGTVMCGDRGMDKDAGAGKAMNIKEWFMSWFSHEKWVEAYLLCPNCDEEITWYVHDTELFFSGDAIRACNRCGVHVVLTMEAKET